jgi:acetolactate synthase-1/2/3 large subunit
MKYSDAVSDLLKKLGYTHCFFLAGGNSMHLLDSARQRFTCIPFVHEVSAGIAAEYFNQVSGQQRAFVLLTAGPGLTNAVTAIAGSYLESRELLVIGGQVKSTDLASGGIRQRGIQEVDGVEIVASISKLSLQIASPIPLPELAESISQVAIGRPGPVFLEMCLDAQATHGDWGTYDFHQQLSFDSSASETPYIRQLDQLIDKSRRPVLLVGGGLPFDKRELIEQVLLQLEIPVMTTWNGADRIGADHPLYFGRPNTWGQRYSNILIQQADLIIAVGTRLGLQQTGFNWEEFGPVAEIVQVDIDPTELEKGHPKVDLSIHDDAARFMNNLLTIRPRSWPEWLSFCRQTKDLLPLSEACNETTDGFLNPYDFILALGEILDSDDLIIPCSSGGAFTTMLQTFQQKSGQRVLTNKSLASMGYGLAGAIGASLGCPDRRVVLVEGDGGFAQNLQELATVSTNSLNLKMFIFSNEGYASIRMTQLNYFNGEYLGCDTQTGLGFPNWRLLAEAYGMDFMTVGPELFADPTALSALESSRPVMFLVPLDPYQTYFPKISSSVDTSGMMRSNPLHLMSPPLSNETASAVFKYLT